MRRAITLVALVASGLGAGVAVSGCGAGGLDTSAVAQAAQTTQNAGTARVQFTANVAGQTLSGGGFVDLKRRLTDLSMTLPQGHVREIYTGQRMYMQLPPSLRKGPLSKKPWMSLDIGAIAKAEGVDLGALQSMSNPGNTVSQLRSVAQVKKVGTATIRGAATTEFTAVVDLRKAVNKAPPALRPAAQKSVDQLIKLMGRSTMPVRLWIDDQKRVRREKIDLTIAGQSFTMTIDLFDFGANQAISPPPADQVTDITKLATQQAAQSIGGGTAQP
jgi:hypothetical protein